MPDISIRQELRPGDGGIVRILTLALIFAVTLAGFSVSAFAIAPTAIDSAATAAPPTPQTQSGGYLTHTSATADTRDAHDALAGYMAHENMFPSFLKITLALIAVIVGIYVTLALLKKAMGRKVSSGARGNALEVIETCYLAPKRSVTLVRVGKRAALLSVADSSISTLLELNADETEEILTTVASQVAGPDFRHSLQKAKQKIVDLGSYALKRRQDEQVESASLKTAK